MNALYYPFHLCHARTLKHILADYQIIHFRDFMALQLTPMMGTTAFPDRMGDYYPDFLKTGRIAQGYNLSGAMTHDTILAVNRDLADAQWRNQFQKFLLNDHRFQRGLFAAQKKETHGLMETPSTPEWAPFSDMTWADKPFEVESVQRLSYQHRQGKEAFCFEYGWALIKTSVSLVYTIQLCQQLDVVAVTDSSAHHQLLARACARDSISVENLLVKREDY